jgi:predicted Zn-dependent protease
VGEITPMSALQAAHRDRAGSPEAGIALAGLAIARAARAGDEGVELFLAGAEEAGTDLVPGLAGAAVTAGGGLDAAARVWRDGRCGFAARAAGGEDEIVRLVAEARAGAAAGDVRAPMPAGLPPTSAGGGRPAELSADLGRQRAEELLAALAGAGLAVQAIQLRQRRWWTAVASTAGARSSEWHHRVTGIVRCETAHGTVVHGVECADVAAGWDAGPACRHAAEAGAVAARADGREPDLRLPLVLRPAVGAHLVAGLGWLLRGTTAAAAAGLPGAVGRRVFPSRLTLVDDPGGAGRPRRADDEGRPAAAVELVRDGLVLGFLHSTASAAALGAEPNGRGLRADPASAPAPGALGLRVRPRGDRPPPDHVELTARFETLWPMPWPGVLTLVAAGWEVRGGRRVRAVGPCDLRLPLLAAWRALRGVGDDLELVAAADRCATPSLVLDAGALPS